MTAVALQRNEVLRVAVLASDPGRREALARLVRGMGFEVTERTSDASVVLSEGEAVNSSAPVLVLGPDGECDGRLSREASAEQIAAALQALSVGLSVGMREPARPRFEASPDVDEHALLTPRELEVLSAVSDGLTNKEIARKLDISRHTVKFHLESLMRKLKVSSRAEAVSKSMRQRLLEPFRL
jgi:DNA-binding NarL/FixJ family response regulator